MNELTVHIKVDEARARSTCDSLKYELGSERHGRTNVSLKVDDGLVLKVTATDLHAMRAAINTYLRWVDMNLKLIN